MQLRGAGANQQAHAQLKVERLGAGQRLGKCTLDGRIGEHAGGQRGAVLLAAGVQPGQRREVEASNPLTQAHIGVTVRLVVAKIYRVGIAIATGKSNF